MEFSGTTGFRCPHCGRANSFNVVCTVVFKFYNGNVDSYVDLPVFNEGSGITCTNCHHCGKASDFLVNRQDGNINNLSIGDAMLRTKSIVPER